MISVHPGGSGGGIIGIWPGIGTAIMVVGWREPLFPARWDEHHWVRYMQERQLSAQLNDVFVTLSMHCGPAHSHPVTRSTIGPRQMENPEIFHLSLVNQLNHSESAGATLRP